MSPVRFSFLVARVANRGGDKEHSIIFSNLTALNTFSLLVMFAEIIMAVFVVLTYIDHQV